MSLACCTLPPTRMRCGVTAFRGAGGGGGGGGAGGGGGGGGGAAVGTDPMMPPMTPPAVPPGTPPGTPPTTPPEDCGGSSSSLIMATSLGTALGAIKRPASNWRGMTLITLGAAATGCGGGGGGGGGATRKLVNWLLGSASK